MAVKKFSGQDVKAEVTWPEEKRCATCKKIKPADQFYKNHLKKDGLHTCCIPCKKAYANSPHSRELARKRRATVTGKARTRKNNLTRKGLTPGQYDDMLAAQGGVCKICHRPPPKGKHLHVDHDHSCCPPRTKLCGKCVRGLLCQTCNYNVLGKWLQEGTKGTARALEISRSLVEYLEAANERA